MDKNSSDGVPLPQRYGAILTIVLGLTMAVLDGAIANVALPTIASDLNASPAASIWIVNAYQIAIVIALLPLSFLGDMVGYRRIYKIGLVVFIFTSLACALSRSLEMLTFARVAQGLGGAALMSQPRLLLLDEPSLGLAPIIIQQIFDTIEQLRKEGMTIFLVEQNANQALKLADRGYVLENGRVVLSDTGDALLANEAVRSAYLGG